MPVENTYYAYSVARIKALETRLLDQSHFDRMINASSGEEAIKVLSETDYGSHMAELSDIHDFEIVLMAQLKDAYELVIKICPDPGLIGMLALRYDVHNLKALFKAKFLGITSDLLIPVGAHDLAKLEQAVNEDDFRYLQEKLRRVADKISEEFLINNDPQVIDLVLDRVLYEQMIYSAKESGFEFLEGLFVRQIDLTNLKTFIRVKRMGLDRDFLMKALLPHGSLSVDRLKAVFDEPLESLISILSASDYADLADRGVREWLEKGTASLLEKLSDDFITEYLKQGKWIPFGIEPLVGYLWAKEVEIKNIRIVLVGKINKLPAEAIRERLRNAYV